ncbi:MAG: helix-turn-helix transcriptional regulator [Solirubrobacteraceae bacterium]
MSQTTACTPHRSAPSALRLARLTLGWSQADLAAAAGRSREQIARLEAGACDPTWTTVQRLARALHADPREIFPNDDSRPAKAAVGKASDHGAHTSP